MTNKTILVQFLVDFNSASESFTLKQNSKYQQLKMIVSGLFDIADSDSIVFFNSEGEKVENCKNDNLISDIFPSILSSDDVVELKVQLETQKDVEFIVIFNSQSYNFKIDENKTLLQLLEVVMSHFKELDFNQFFKLIHNKINLLEVYDVNRQLSEIVKELNVEKSSQIILIIELEKSVGYMSNNPNMPQQLSKDSLNASKVIGQSQKILRYVYMCPNNCKNEANNICAKCFAFICDGCKKREPHLMHSSDIIKISKFNDLLKLFVEKCLKKLDENVINDDTFVFLQSFQTNIQNDIDQINKTFNFIKNMIEEIKEIQINYLISIQEKMNYSERFKDINKNLEVVFHEFKEFNSETTDVEYNMNFMKDMTEKVAKLIFDYKNLSNFFHIYRTANSNIEQNNKNLMQTLKEKSVQSQAAFNISNLSQKVSTFNKADNIKSSKKNSVGQVVMRLKDSSTMLCFKVKTNKLKTKAFTDKSNFRTYFQGEDEIELNLDNKLFIVTGKKYNVFFYFDYEKNEIYKLTDLKFSHFFGNLIYCELNSNLYCLGGINSKKCEMYRNDEIVFTNVSTDKKVAQKTWETLPDLNVSRHECSSIFHNNFLYVFFGYNNLTNFNNNTIERMNIMKHENWEIVSYTNPSYLNVTLNSHSIIKYNENELLILGGFDGKHYRDSIFIFNVKTNSFHQTNLKIPDLKKNTYYYFFKESSFAKITEYDNVIDHNLPNYCLFDSNNRLHVLNTRKFNYQIVNSIE